MTVPVKCKKGKCEYKDDELNKEWKDDCVDCSLDEQIEHDLERKSSKVPK